MYYVVSVMGFCGSKMGWSECMLGSLCIHGGERGVMRAYIAHLTLDSCSPYMITYMQMHSCSMGEHFMCLILTGRGDKSSVKTIKYQSNWVKLGSDK